MDKIIFVVLMEACSVLFLYLGYLLWKKEKISIMHSYHYKKVRNEDRKAYTAVMGKAMVVIGLGMAVSGIIGFFINSAKSGIPFGISLILGLGMMTYGQIKYNQGIF